MLSLMQDHHRGAVQIADYAAKNAKSAWVRELAARMARNQRIEINEREQARMRTGLPANPAGCCLASGPDLDGHSDRQGLRQPGDAFVAHPDAAVAHIAA